MLRPATPADLSAVLNLTARCVRGMLAAGIDQWDDAYPNRQVLEADISRGELWLLSDPALIGCICINAIQSPEYAPLPWEFPSESASVFHRLMVDPDHQGRGHARQMIHAAEKIAAAAGARSIRLDTYVANPPAVRLYDSLGYQRRGTVHFRQRAFFCFEKELLRDSRLKEPSAD